MIYPGWGLQVTMGKAGIGVRREVRELGDFSAMMRGLPGLNPESRLDYPKNKGIYDDGGNFFKI